MKTRTSTFLSILVLAFAAAALGGCASKEDPNYLWLLAAGGGDGGSGGGSAGGEETTAEETPFTVDVTDVTGDEEFIFDNTRTIPVFITVKDPVAPVDGSLVQVLEIAGGSNKVIFQAVSGEEGSVTGSFTINRATDVVHLKITYQGVSYTYDITVTDVLEIKRTIFVTADLAPVTVVDTDGDGVPDEADAFPEDATRAATVRIPSESYYTVAFEDLYPTAGDADFNDYVLRVFHEEDLNAAGEVVRIRGTYTHIAKGAGYNHTLHLSLPGGLAADYTLRRFSAAGDLLNETAATTGAFANVEILPASNTTLAQSNTAQGQSFVVGARAEIEITLASPVARTALGAAPYDLYLYVKNTKKEIHFLGRYFDAAGKDIYLDSKGFPWALLVPGDWRWPYEKQNIHTGYEFFDDWYTSLGQAFLDWYGTANEAYVFPVL